jgi:transposase
MTPNEVVAHFGGSVRQAAKALDLVTATIYVWIDEGRIPRLRQLDIQELTEGRLIAEPREPAT